MYSNFAMLDSVLFRDITIYSVVLRLTLAMVVGGILGIERGIKNRPAGFRTYVLVCMGATIVMMTGQYISTVYGASDPARMGSQVVSGIGFLGAGTIIVTKKSQVRGLTTAAGLWVAAAIGLAIGIGFYLGAILSAISIIFVMTVLAKMDLFIKKRSKTINLYAEYNEHFVLGEFFECLQRDHYDILDFQLSKCSSQENSTCAMFFTVQSKGAVKHQVVIGKISTMKGITYIEEL